MSEDISVNASGSRRRNVEKDKQWFSKRVSGKPKKNIWLLIRISARSKDTSLRFQHSEGLYAEPDRGGDFFLKQENSYRNLTREI
jgi:hypothetical protein